MTYTPNHIHRPVLQPAVTHIQPNYINITINISSSININTVIIIYSTKIRMAPHTRTYRRQHNEILSSASDTVINIYRIQWLDLATMQQVNTTRTHCRPDIIQIINHIGRGAAQKWHTKSIHLMMKRRKDESVKKKTNSKRRNFLRFFLLSFLFIFICSKKLVWNTPNAQKNIENLFIQTFLQRNNKVYF